MTSEFVIQIEMHLRVKRNVLLLRILFQDIRSKLEPSWANHHISSLSLGGIMCNIDLVLCKERSGLCPQLLECNVCYIW